MFIRRYIQDRYICYNTALLEINSLLIFEMNKNMENIKSLKTSYKSCEMSIEWDPQYFMIIWSSSKYYSQHNYISARLTLTAVSNTLRSANQRACYSHKFVVHRISNYYTVFPLYLTKLRVSKP